MDIELQCGCLSTHTASVFHVHASPQALYIRKDRWFVLLWDKRTCWVEPCVRWSGHQNGMPSSLLLILHNPCLLRSGNIPHELSRRDSARLRKCNWDATLTEAGRAKHRNQFGSSCVSHQWKCYCTLICVVIEHLVVPKQYSRKPQQIFMWAWNRRI